MSVFENIAVVIDAVMQRMTRERIALSLFAVLLLSALAFSSNTPPKNVTVCAYSEKIYVRTNGSIVADVLEELGIELEKTDVVEPDVYAKVRDKMIIKINKYEERLVIRKEKIPCKSVVVSYSSLLSDSKMDLRDGEDGVKETLVKERYVDGEKIDAMVIKENVVKKPINGITVKGIKTMNRERKSDMLKNKVMKIVATAYYPGYLSCGKFADGITSVGARVGYGIVATDPRVIPLGTRMYIEGYGYGVAADVGGAIKGKKIDLCFNTYKEAKSYGRKNIKVYILE